MKHSEVFTVNRFGNSENSMNRISEFVAGKRIISMVSNDSFLSYTVTVVVEDLPEPVVITKLVDSPQPMPGKGNGTSRYRGVYWDKECSRWRAQLSYKGKRKMKRFETEIEAAEQYDIWAREIIALGGKAYPNFEKVAK